MVMSNSLDLTEGLLGREVPKTSGKIQWKDGHTSILPAVYNKYQINVCNHVDAPIVKYLAKFPPSMPESKHILYFTNNDFQSEEILDWVEGALSNNILVVIRGVEHQPLCSEFTPDYLDKYFGISPNQAVYLHGKSACELEFMVHPDRCNRCRGSCRRPYQCHEAWHYCIIFCINFRSKEDSMCFGLTTCTYHAAAAS
jgi:hypothetical protein